LVWRAEGPRREVVAVAGVAGVRPGQALSDAQAVAPEVAAVEADPAAEPTAFRRLMARAAGVGDFKAVKPAVERARKSARNGYEIIVQV
ncbi:MAG TPA: hypothetical protein PKA17_04630, partial [Phenylobacterium sp.]|nr:hypothetical protein [Phenylobacterium sp.]